MIGFVHVPPNETSIDELFAFLSVDEGGEGICAAIIPNLGSTTLVTGRRNVAEQMKEFAAEIAQASGKRIEMIRFTRADVMWATEPVNTPGK